MDQRRRALELANAQRRAIFALHIEIRAGRISLQDALADPALARVQVRRVLLWLHYVGPKRTDWALTQLRISPDRPCGRLSPRERRALQDRLL